MLREEILEQIKFYKREDITSLFESALNSAGPIENLIQIILNQEFPSEYRILGIKVLNMLNYPVDNNNSEIFISIIMDSTVNDYVIDYICRNVKSNYIFEKIFLQKFKNEPNCFVSLCEKYVQISKRLLSSDAQKYLFSVGSNEYMDVDLRFEACSCLTDLFMQYSTSLMNIPKFFLILYTQIPISREYFKLIYEASKYLCMSLNNDLVDELDENIIKSTFCQSIKILVYIISYFETTNENLLYNNTITQTFVKKIIEQISRFLLNKHVFNNISNIIDILFKIIGLNLENIYLDDFDYFILNFIKLTDDNEMGEEEEENDINIDFFDQNDYFCSSINFQVNYFLSICKENAFAYIKENINKSQLINNGIINYLSYMNSQYQFDFQEFFCFSNQYGKIQLLYFLALSGTKVDWFNDIIKHFIDLQTYKIDIYLLMILQVAPLEWYDLEYHPILFLRCLKLLNDFFR